MPSITLIFSGNYGLGCKLKVDPDVGGSAAVLMAVAASRCKILAKSQPDRVKDTTGQAILMAEMEVVGEGPVKLHYENLGCPRDQMLAAASFFEFYSNFLWMRAHTPGPIQQNQQAKLALPGSEIFGAIFRGGANPSMQ